MARASLDGISRGSPAVITLARVVLILPGVMEGRRNQLVDHMGERRCAVSEVVKNFRAEAISRLVDTYTSIT